MKRRKHLYSHRENSFLRRRIAQKSKRRLLLTVIISAVLIYLLTTWFLPQFIGGLSLINHLKDQPPTPIPADENAILAPPVLNIPYEATNTASIKIKGYALAQTEVEIYLDDELKSTLKATDDGSFLSEDILLSLGINNIYGKTVDSKGEKSLPSKLIKVIYDNERPKLELREPADNQLATNAKITVSGATDSEGSLITINGTRVIINYAGDFSQTVDLTEGENVISVVASDPAGNTSQISRKVTYQKETSE